MVSHYNELASRYNELVARYYELVSRYYELVSRYNELVSRYFEDIFFLFFLNVLIGFRTCVRLPAIRKAIKVMIITDLGQGPKSA